MIVEDEVKLVFFKFSWQRVFFERYPEHLLMDATYCLVNRRMPLYIALVVDGTNNSIPVAFCFVANETKEIVDYFVKCFVEHNRSAGSVQSLMTDKDFTEIEVLSKYFPSASHELRLFHVLKNFKTLVQVPMFQRLSQMRLKGC